MSEECPESIISKGDKGCNKCGQTKPLSEFYKDKATPDGIRRWCKACDGVHDHIYCKAHREQKAEYSKRSYYKNHQARIARAQAKRETHPEICRATDKVNCAIRSGRLERRRCERCGAFRTDAHHEDYNNPLEVIFLCRPCHSALHRKKEVAQ